MMQMVQFQEERRRGAISAVRSMDRLVEATIEYCRERETFGQPLIANQSAEAPTRSCSASSAS